MGLELISFWIIAIITLISASKVALSKNIVHSALFLVATFVGVAGIYLLMHATFLAAVQILVYGGAIAIILVFGVMLTQREDMTATSLFNKARYPTIIVMIVMVTVIGSVFLNTDWVTDTMTEPVSVNEIATVMLNQFVIPFEVVAMLLLVAMVGAIVLAKEK